MLRGGGRLREGVKEGGGVFRRMVTLEEGQLTVWCVDSTYSDR